MVTLYQVKPSEKSRTVWAMSGNENLMRQYAQELNGVVVKKEVVRIDGTNRMLVR